MGIIVLQSSLEELFWGRHEILKSLPEDSSDELAVFAFNYLKNRNSLAINSFDLIDAIACVESVYGIVLYRENNFQVQLFICPPFTHIQEHEHPNVDSFECNLSGDLDFYVENMALLPEHLIGNKHYMMKAVRVKQGAKHELFVGARGGSFISIQHWLNGVQPTSVGQDWIGNTMGNIHTSTLKRKEEQSGN